VGGALDTSVWTFINPETTVHLHAYPGGEWVGLESLADNLVEDPPTQRNRTQTYLRNLATGQTELLSRSDEGVPGDGPSFRVALDHHGRVDGLVKGCGHWASPFPNSL
jgi:hypothetical protein